MLRPVWIVAALTLALVAFVPVDVAAQDDVLVLGQHTLTLQKSGKNVTANVHEIIHYSVDQNEYSGTLRLDLDPQATVTAWYMTDRNGTPLPGPAGQASTDDIPSEDVEGFKRHTIDLGANNVTFRPDQTYGLHLFYSLPGNDPEFKRRVDLPTPQLNLFVQSTPGLEPRSDDLDLRPVGNTWTYNLPAEDRGPWVPGEVVAFTLTEVNVPKSPLAVSISSTGSDPIRLRANVEGGIAPYTVTWDTDGDNDCDDATGDTFDLERGETGTKRVTACVADARGDAFAARDTYETRIVEGPTVRTGPTAWLLGLVGLIIGALLVYGLAAGGIVKRGGARESSSKQSSGGRSLAVESKDMLSTRQRVMVAALKELEIAKKKGEVADGVYTPLKAELKQDTVRVMREIEKRKEETV